ncbi:DNA repair protein [Ruegeria sp. 2205SS24-7]|uniref:DNA repair protein n=1 Tax=Ruegeria discodermiae TaxID=3064389 RepID=UPI002740558C|nr:DNA repair protein [Ruegeria sp. 2205SS24-7]MDP5216593.1 DNA repair protein [Ruegeria sp. 2205SS24-7]
MTLLSAMGVLPWLSLSAGVGDTMSPLAGPIAQIALTCLILMLAFYLPANARIMALERSHRNFAINMNDVANAYHAAHSADREGYFNLSSEFDAVKERLAFMREHPDLEDLEPDVLELAAQMSQISRELARIYSDDKVARAKGFLLQRQEELERFNKRVGDAKIVLQEMRQWHHEIEIEESVARSQLARIREEMFELLPELAVSQNAEDGDNILPLQPGRAAE